MAEPFFSPSSIQPKLKIGAPNDKYEQEADSMADQVVQRLAKTEATSPAIDRKNNPSSKSTGIQRNPIFDSPGIGEEQVQPKCATCEAQEEGMVQRMEATAQKETPDVQTKCANCEAEEGIQPKRMPAIQRSGDGSLQASNDFSSRLQASKGGGSPMSSDTRSSMEGAMGADFSDVRIHTGGEASSLSNDIGAQAFTHGSDVYFNDNKYDPGSSSGQHLLAHELTHTVQQGGSISPKIQRSNPPVVQEPPVRPNAQACLIHLHGDEKKALSVAKGFHGSHCVNLTYIDNPRKRLIKIDVPGHRGLKCAADPNRIFQDAAIDRNWRTWNTGRGANTDCNRNPKKTAAINAVKAYRDNELNPKIRQCRGQTVDANDIVAGSGVAGSLPVLAFHNNTNTPGNSRSLSIRSYEIGGREQNATETNSSRLAPITTQITQNPGQGNLSNPINPHIQQGQDIDDFILVTDTSDFIALFREGRNVVLQSQTPPQDGSLSVVLSSGRYINVEAQKNRSNSRVQQGMGQDALTSLNVGPLPCPSAQSPVTVNQKPNSSSSNQVVSPKLINKSVVQPIIQKQDDNSNALADTREPSTTSNIDAENSEFQNISLDEIWDFLGELLTETFRVLGQLGTMPTPLPRQAPPSNLPQNCLTFSAQTDLDARKAHWVGIIASMSPADVINWIIGLHNPPAGVGVEVDRQKGCMLQAMSSSSGVSMPANPWTQRHRGFRRQSSIWRQKFNFTRRTPFDRISSHAQATCGTTLLPTSETQWDTSEPRHRSCWGVSSTVSMPQGFRALTDDEKQREILEASSAPGISRHHWGTDVDLFSTEPTDFETGHSPVADFVDEYSWLMSNAGQYGFLQSYTAISAFMGLGYMEERWHWSYWPISQALLDYTRMNQSAVHAALMAQWGTHNRFSFIRQHWRDFMFNVNETPNI